MPFNPEDHMIKVQGGRKYLPVSARLIWFREEHPDWTIRTSPVEINVEKQYAIFRAEIYRPAGEDPEKSILVASATKMENVRGFADYIEKAETGAVGRALAHCGFGTQFAPELDEHHRLADAPTPDRNASASKPEPTEDQKRMNAKIKRCRAMLKEIGKADDQDGFFRAYNFVNKREGSDAEEPVEEEGVDVLLDYLTEKTEGA